MALGLLLISAVIFGIDRGPAFVFDLGGKAAQSPPANYDESKVGSYTLPDPLVFNDGKPVRTAGDWRPRLWMAC